MIVCSHCGKENLEHYKFCLGCGGDLTAARAPSSAPAPTPPVAASGTDDGDGDDLADGDDDDEDDDEADAPTTLDYGAAVAARGQGAAPPPAAAGPAARMATPAHVASVPPAPARRACPNCGHLVPPEFVFCGSCGTRVGDGAAASAPRTVLASAPAPRTQPRGRLILIRPDGSEGGSHPLEAGDNAIGRTEGSVFESDTYLSPRHAIFSFRNNTLFVRDAGSLNGVFVKMTTDEELEEGDVFRVGQELLRYEAIGVPEPLDDGTEVMGSPNPGYWGRLCVILGRGQDGAAYPLFGDTITIGRERGDIQFPEDGYVSGTHARVTRRAADGRVFLADLRSSNGSFLRIRAERALPPGTFLLLGQQLFRAHYA